ncbi:uncharacterized protein K444DRAFT_525885, partial [Hyaloscypha bicolor E]
ICDYTQVEFYCDHIRYTVRAWCTNYETTYKRCPSSVVAIEFRYVEINSQVSNTPNKKHRDEYCGDCRALVINPSWTKNSRIQT